MWCLSVVLIAAATVHLSCSQMCQHNIEPVQNMECDLVNKTLPYNHSHCRTNDEYDRHTHSDFPDDGKLELEGFILYRNGTSTFEVDGLAQNITINLDWAGLTQDEGHEFSWSLIVNKTVDREDGNDAEFTIYNHFLLTLLNETAVCFNMSKLIYTSWSDTKEMYENSTVFQSAVINAEELYILVLFESQYYHWSGNFQITISTNGTMKKFTKSLSQSHDKLYLYKITNDEIVPVVSQCVQVDSHILCHGGCAPLENIFSGRCTDGELDQLTPVCPDIECGSVPDIKNGTWRVSTKDGLKVTYSCNTGSYMSGNSTIKCACNTTTGNDLLSGEIINGIWNDTQPECIQLRIPYDEDDDVFGGWVFPNIRTYEILYLFGQFIPDKNFKWLFIYKNCRIAFGKGNYPYISGLNITRDDDALNDAEITYFSANQMYLDSRQTKTERILREVYGDIDIKNMAVTTWDNIKIEGQKLRLQIVLFKTNYENMSGYSYYTMIIYDWEKKAGRFTESEKLHVEIRGGKSSVPKLRNYNRNTDIPKGNNVYISCLWNISCPEGEEGLTFSLY